MNIATFTSKRFLIPAVLLLVVVLLATAPLFIRLGNIVIMTELIMYCVLTVSWVMFSGPTGYMSLATAAFFGVGIYASALLFAQDRILLPMPAVIIIGGLASFCLALVIGAVTLRLRGIYFAMFTFGLVELGNRFLNYFELEIMGTRGRVIAPLDTTTLYYIALAILVAVMVTTYLIRRSRYGLALQGIGEYEEAAAHMGVNTTMVKIITFAISAFFMGAMGAATAPRWLYADPTTAFNLNYTFLPVLMALVGGMGQLYGPILGAVGFGYLRYALLTKAPYQFMLIFGITLVVFVVFLPQGLGGLIQRAQNRLGGVISKLRKGGQAEQHANT
jgi:branched-chain amino acid transport system permease protein